MVGSLAVCALLSLCPCDAVTPSFLQRGSQASLAVLEKYYAIKHKVAPIFDVVNTTSIEQTKVPNCLCPIGSFYHWRVHGCVEQGYWGYECGFFPGEHHHRVCADNLKCEATVGAPDTYVWHGRYEGTAGSFPASCQHCNTTDACKVGKERHEADCLKEIAVSGEACATVRVTVPQISASATATVKHTANAEVTHEARAEASATASHEATATATAEASAESAGEEATATAKGSATETAHTSATAEGSASHTASESATASASASATGQADGVAESTACVTIPDVMDELGLKNGTKLSTVVAQEIIDTGDAMALERASNLALNKAKQMGLLSAQDLAEAAAQAAAAEKAKLEAERMAHEAAAWQAEAGANADAQRAAAARAEGLAGEQAKLKAEEAAARRAEANASKAAAAAARAEADRLAAEAAKAGASADDKAMAEAADNAAADAEAQAAAAGAAADEAEKDKPKKEKLKPVPKQPDTTNVLRKVSNAAHKAGLP